MSDSRGQLIRNSTAEFLIFTGHAGEQSIEARYEGETDWLTQKLMAELFDISKQTIEKSLFADRLAIQRDSQLHETAAPAYLKGIDHG